MKLLTYITNNIIPAYRACDRGHDIEHVSLLILNGTKYVRHLKKTSPQLYGSLDDDILLTIFACLDRGLVSHSGESHRDIRSTHHLRSGAFVRGDLFLNTYFSKESINIIVRAVENHRSSNKSPIDEIYANIATDVDRMDAMDVKRMIHREWYCRVDVGSDIGTNEEIFEAVYDHLTTRYIALTGQYTSPLYRLDETEEYMRPMSIQRDIILKDKGAFMAMAKNMVAANLLDRNASAV